MGTGLSQLYRPATCREVLCALALHASLYYGMLFPCIWKTINRSFMHMALLFAMRMCFRMPSSESTSVPQENLLHLGHVS